MENDITLEQFKHFCFSIWKDFNTSLIRDKSKFLENFTFCMSAGISLMTEYEKLESLSFSLEKSKELNAIFSLTLYRLSVGFFWSNDPDFSFVLLSKALDGLDKRHSSYVAVEKSYLNFSTSEHFLKTFTVLFPKKTKSTIDKNMYFYLTNLIELLNSFGSDILSVGTLGFIDWKTFNESRLDNLKTNTHNIQLLYFKSNKKKHHLYYKIYSDKSLSLLIVYMMSNVYVHMIDTIVYRPNLENNYEIFGHLNLNFMLLVKYALPSFDFSIYDAYYTRYIDAIISGENVMILANDIQHELRSNTDRSTSLFIEGSVKIFNMRLQNFLKKPTNLFISSAIELAVLEILNIDSFGDSLKKYR